MMAPLWYNLQPDASEGIALSASAACFPPLQHTLCMRRNYGALRNHECELLSKASLGFVVHELRNCGSVSFFVCLHKTLRPACKDRGPIISVLC